ncbi:MAG: hypothetical protein JWP87_5157 [Labilithrix sp.]|nr:hypothetical protein [Labilithrix sp.]
MVILVVSSTRARAARSAADAEAAESATLLPADQLTPVPMSVEPTGGPTKPPPSFVSSFSPGPRTHLSESEESAIVKRARLEIDRVTVYDNTWIETSSFPMGDIPSNRGACTDVVVRSLREIGIDLQQLVHDDLAHDLKGYGAGFTDPNIDHRRVGTMFTFFQRNAMSLTHDVRDKAAWRAGDIVFVAWTWTRGAPPEHVGVISDKIGPRGLPLVIENGGPKAVEADSLGHGKVVGHFRALKKQR